LTAHDINARKRDSNDTPLNRLTLKAQYRLADHIFVHTEKMKSELSGEFGIHETAITVIPFGINNSVPNTSLTPQQAKRRLGISDGEKTILFFGRIGPYKGLESLVAAFQQITKKSTDYRLIIAGKPKKGAEEYLEGILKMICCDGSRERVIIKIEYIPDQETELYFKAADVLALPYAQIYQSGVLFLAYGFGLPVIATAVGSFDIDIVDGQTGFLCKPGDSADLARATEVYFASDLYKQLDRRRQDIRDHGNERHSWDSVAELTRNIYAALLRRRPS
jgi:D-inositol-3-phosphate glycosyltransferase